MKDVSSTSSQNSSLVRIEIARFTKPANPPSTTAPTYYLPTTGGRYTLANVDGINWTIRNQFNYDRVFGKDKQQITAILGMEIQSGVSTSNSNTRRVPCTLISEHPVIHW